MANNTTVTPGTGLTVATDDVGGTHYQVIKLAAGTEDSAVRLGSLEDAAHSSGDAGIMALAVRNDAGSVLAGTTGDYIPLTTDSSGNLRSLVTGTVALSATEVHMGQVGGTTQIVQVTPTVSTTPAYTAGDIIGGIMTFTNALRITSGTGAVLSVNVTEVGTQKAAIDLILFSASPAGGTYTDNGAPTWDTGDYNKLLGVIHVLAADYTTYGAISVATVRNQPVGVWGNAVANIYGVMVAVGTPTYSATTSLRITITTLAD